VAGRRAAGPEGAFLLWAGLPWWGLSFLYNREIGAARDWDLFATASLPMILLSGMLLARLLAAAGPSRTARAAVGLVLAVSAFHTLPWVALGRYPGRSLVHFASLYGPGSTASPFARSYAWEEIGTYYKNQEQPDNAVRAFQTAVRADTTNGRVAGILAGLLIATGRSEEALPVLETAVRRTPYRAYLHFQLGTVYRERGDADRARAAFTEALKRDPDLVEASIGLSVVERTTGRVQAAERILQDAIRRFPDEPLLWSHLGLVFQAKGDSLRAMESYRQALEKNPEDMTSTFNLGLLLLDTGRFAEARPYFEQVVGRQPQDVDAWVNLGVCLDAVGHPNGALTAFRRAWSINPYRPESYFHAVQIHMARGDTAAAVVTLRQFLARDATSLYGRAAESLLRTLTGGGG
jgi:Tfp pilus assembly protein PilF